MTGENGVPPCLRRLPGYTGRRNRARPAVVSRAPAAIITSHGAGFAGGRGAVPPNPADTAPFGMILLPAASVTASTFRPEESSSTTMVCTVPAAS